jgi:hypothetical protein
VQCRRVLLLNMRGLIASSCSSPPRLWLTAGLLGYTILYSVIQLTFESWHAGCENCQTESPCNPLLTPAAQACPTYWVGRTTVQREIKKLPYQATVPGYESDILQSHMAGGTVSFEQPRALSARSGEVRRSEKAKVDATVSAQESTSFAGSRQGVP